MFGSCLDYEAYKILNNPAHPLLDSYTSLNLMCVGLRPADTRAECVVYRILKCERTRIRNLAPC